MHPELFRIPGTRISIHSYGLMMVIGFFAATELAKFLARRNRINPDHYVNAALLALVSGVIGARLSHVLENFAYFTSHDRTAWQNFVAMIDVTAGGLTYYGGFLLAFPTLVLYAIWKKIPLRLGMDIIAPCIMIGLGFGRIGCYLNGCCYGVQCSWGVQFPYGSNAYLEQYSRGELSPPGGELLKDAKDTPGKRLVTAQELEENKTLKAVASLYKAKPVLPAELYSALTAFLLAGVLLAYLTMPHAPGRVFALMCLLEGASRFLLEMVRVEDPVLGPLSLSMVIGAGVVAIGIVLWFIYGARSVVSNQQSLAARS